jgi:hypothetical protein
MSNNLSVNIESLHAAMLAAIQAQFPTLATVAYYPRPGEKIETPAVLLELDSIEADSPAQTGTEQLPVLLRFAAYCVGSYHDGQKLAIRTLATSLMAFVNLQQWGQPVRAASIVDARPDNFRQEGNKEYEVLRVEFTHEALLGSDVWPDTGSVPTQVFASGDAEPNNRIGELFLPDYVKVK